MKKLILLSAATYLLTGCVPNDVKTTEQVTGVKPEEVVSQKSNTEPNAPKYLTDAMKKLESEAEKGDVDAQYRLAGAYEKGLGLEKNEKRSFYWYKKAADAGHAMSQAYIGFLYSIGKGVPQSYSEAVRWYKLAASNGSVTAVYNMGVAFEHGVGVDRNPAESIRWYKKAAELGNNEAQCAPVATNDLLKPSEKTPEKQSPSTDGRVDNKEIAAEHKEKPKLDLLKLQSAEGDVSATMKVAYMHLYGNAGVEQNSLLAVEFLTIAANRGNVEAMERLADIYEYGSFGIEENKNTAYAWRKKAKKRQPIAQNPVNYSR